MILIGLPPFLSPLAALLMALFGAIAVTRSTRPNVRLPKADDAEDRIDSFTRKVRRDAKVRRWLGR